MCILFGISDPESSPALYKKLLLVFNRDERYERKTRSLHLWSDNRILAGQDETCYGTWLGLSKTGLMAALTNHRHVSPPSSDKTSRGLLVSNFLTFKCDSHAIHDYVNHIFSHSARLFNGFTLLLAQIGLDTSKNELRIMHHTNASSHLPLAESTEFMNVQSNEIFSTGNGSIFEPDRPKMKLGKLILDQILADKIDSEDTLIHRLFHDLLCNMEKHENDLPVETYHSRQVELELSSIFVFPFSLESTHIHTGTTSSTIIMIDEQGLAIVLERDWKAFFHSYPCYAEDLKTFQQIVHTFDFSPFQKVFRIQLACAQHNKLTN